MRPYFFFLIILSFLSCNDEPTQDVQINIIPVPAELAISKGHFKLNGFKTFYIDESFNELKFVFNQLANFRESESKNGADLKLHFDKSLAAEAYSIKIEEDEMNIRASDSKGMFYGLMTFRQLVDQHPLKIPCLEIKDQAHFKYRGMHLDVARHFYPVDFVKQYIDLLAYYKFNYFHWHLTEDQGWRIEIKKYPKLQEVAAYREETLIGHYTDQPHQFDGKKYGGYYTQEEIKEVVAYAESRQITVIPEIEMPGHSLAALSAYPELACSRGPFKAATKWGVFEHVYCPTETTFQFLEDVIDEVIALFPGPYIHIGGDECPKTSWKESDFCQQLIKHKNLKDEHGLQSYFIQRMEKYINSKGKSIIGWDEILEGGLAPNATVMSWRGVEGGIEAANAKHDVIMTPTSHCYFDYYQSTSQKEPLAIGGYLPLEKVYRFDPIPAELDEEAREYILGAQGNVWTEYMPSQEQVIYMAFPRAMALSEVLWSYPSERDYGDFVARVESQINQWDAKGVKMANHLYEIKLEMESIGGGVVRVKSKPLPVGCALAMQDSLGNYRKDGVFNMTGPSTFRVMQGNEFKGEELRLNPSAHLAFGSKVSLKYPPHSKYEGFGATSLVNGISANPKAYSGNEWLGFDGKDMVLSIDLGSVKELSYGSIEFFNSPDSWIYPPTEVMVEAAADEENYFPILQKKVKESSNKHMVVELPLRTFEARYLRVRARNHGMIKSGQGEGNPAWLFVGEVVL